MPKQNTVYGLKPKYCVSLLAVLLGWVWAHADSATSRRAMGLLCGSHPNCRAVGFFSCSSCFSSFPRGKQPVDPGTRGLTHPTSCGWSYSISMEYSSVTCSQHKLPSPAECYGFAAVRLLPCCRNMAGLYFSSVLPQVFCRAGTYLVKTSSCFRKKKNAVKMKISLLCK